jgi:hypothetical protein
LLPIINPTVVESSLLDRGTFYIHAGKMNRNRVLDFMPALDRAVLI